MKTNNICKVIWVGLFLCHLYSCTQDVQMQNMQHAYSFLNTLPDSTLKLLSQIDRETLSQEETAYYNLVYTIAQDKSGLDIDKDSLLRFSYNHYKNRPDDSLYAKCMYYTGKYYQLNDSAKQAEDCLHKSISAAEKAQDRYTQYLALNRLSRSLKQSNPEEAVKTAKQAYAIYNQTALANEINKAYLLIDIGNSFKACHRFDSALAYTKAALCMAEKISNATLKGNAYQAISNAFERTGQNDSALYFIRKAWETIPNKTESLTLALSDCLIKEDSLEVAEKLLVNISKQSKVIKYSAFHFLSKIAFAQNDLIKAQNFYDSTRLALESMYFDSQTERSEYSTETYQLAHINELQKSNYQTRVFALILISILLFSVLALLYYLYKTQKRENAQREELAKERREKLEIIIQNKEQQIDIMRKYVLTKFKAEDTLPKVKQHRDKIDNEIWDEVSTFLDCSQNFFVTRLKEKYPTLTEDEVHFCMLLQLGINNTELADIYGISIGGIKNKQRLFKQKISLPSDITLREFINNFSELQDN